MPGCGGIDGGVSKFTWMLAGRYRNETTGGWRPPKKNAGLRILFRLIAAF
jgi:hypothetical protein